MIDVQAINLSARIALLTDGRAVPITNLLDAAGLETTSRFSAVSFVCGEGREWFSDLIDHYEAVTIQ